MRKTILYFLLISALIFSACSSIKSTQKAINSGDYEKAISIAIKNLEKNKTKEKHQPYVIMLEEAFQKATERDLSRLTFLEKENQSNGLRTIYDLYVGLKNRQERIKPLLPLRNLATGRNVTFDFRNYDDQIITAKEKYAAYLYENAVAIFNDGQYGKMNYRIAYDKFRQLSNLYPHYKDIDRFMEETHARGTDYVFVAVRNETDQIIPRRLEQDLLALDTYGLNDFWTVYHAQKTRGVSYDFDLELNFRRISVSPEQIREKEIIKERKIKNGYKYLTDDQGNFVKDSLGNKIKVDKFIPVRCKLYRFTQFKSSRVVGIVKYIDNVNHQVVEQFPIDSEFVFEHSYADYDGDKRALDDTFLDLIRLESVRFPTNEQMVYDTGTDLKRKLKNIIRRNKFRG